MSAAVQRRERKLHRERANISRHGGKKSSKQLRQADHGLDGQDEYAARSLDALLRARQDGGPVVLLSDLQGPLPEAGQRPQRRTLSPQQRRLPTSSPAAFSKKHKDSAAERMLAELHEGLQDGEDGGGDDALPVWFETRWAAAAAALRAADGALGRSLGHRPRTEELREDEDAAAALAALERLRDQRAVLRASNGGEGYEYEGGVPLGEGAASAANSGEATGNNDNATREEGAVAGDSGPIGGVFHGYSRELLRIRQLLARYDESESALALTEAAGGSAARAQLMLTALARRATADASVLPPPPLLPGVEISDSDPVQARYLWLCERAQRMEGLASMISAADADAREHIAISATPRTAAAERRTRLLRSDALSRLQIEEHRERLCERGAWKPMLAEWRAAGDGLTLHSKDAAAPPSLRGWNQAAFPSGGVTPAANTMRGDTARSNAPTARGSGLPSRLQFLVAGGEMPWVDAVAKEYGLEYGARQRAAGVAREMAAAGYTTAQARAVVLGMLHGTQEKLSAAWRVFVPQHGSGSSGVLSRAEWRPVLGLITGGLGMNPSETDQLFSVFDVDGSGTLDFPEFCEVLDALPLQRTVDESPLGIAVSALQSLFVLRSQLLQRLSIQQLASAGRIIGRLRGAGFTEDDASTVIQALFISRSRKALRKAWRVLRRACEQAGSNNEDSHGGGDGDDIDTEQFKTLLPLLGEDLPLARVERLFEEVDVDKNGTIDFDEFVTMVRRLRPKGAARNGRSAGLSAFATLTSVRSGKARLLRRDVPISRRGEAGMMLLTLRDFGYDDEQLVAILHAFYPPAEHAHVQEEPDGAGDDDDDDDDHVDADRGLGLDANGSPEVGLAVMRAAWTAVGGGTLVRLPVNPFDFKTRLRDSAAGRTANEVLAHQASRWQSASGVDIEAFTDLLNLLAETLGMSSGWPEQVLAPLEGRSDSFIGGLAEREISLAQFTQVLCAARTLLAEAAESAAASADSASAEQPATQGIGSGLLGMNPLLALKGPVRTNLSDESFVNPLRHLARGEERGFDPRAGGSRHCGLDCGGPDTWADGIDSLGERASDLKHHVATEVADRVFEPLLQLGENVDPLLPLSKTTRKLIPHWQAPKIGEVVTALRAVSFPSHHVDTLIRGMYVVRDGGEHGREAARRVWRVLRFHASRFRSDAEVAAAHNDPAVSAETFRRARREFREDREETFNDGAAGQEWLPVEEDPAFDHHALENNACRRMLRILSKPLMRRPQLDALISAFDRNHDGAMSVSEISKLLRMLDPHRRLERLKPISMPEQETAISKATAAVADATAPVRERLGVYWHQFSAMVGKRGDADGDDDDDASFVVRM